MALVHDLVYAVRSLRRSAGFTLIAVMILALGIGANTAIFSVINSVLLAPLPYPDSHRIVALSTISNKTGRQIPRLTGGDLLDIRADSQLFDAISYYYGGELGVQLRDRAEFTGTFFVNVEFFRIFGVQTVAGRLLQTDDIERAVVVSQAFAERNFGTAAAALGQPLRVENRSYQIAGVLPVDFRFPPKAELWIPATEKPQNLNRTAYNYRTVAKLKPGVALESANARLDTIGSHLAAAFPDSNRDKGFAAASLRDELVAPARGTLYLLMGAVALVLLIACTNVADLMLARATARSREMAVRAALGARRWHILRPLLVESMMLAVGGGALGILLAWLGLDVLLRIAANHVPLPRLDEIRIDHWVLVFVSAISLLTSLLFGIVPAFRTRVDVQEDLKQGGSRGMLGGRSPGLRNALVVAQIAFSFVLAIGAGLLLRSFVALTRVQPGYRAEGRLVMYAHVPARTLDDYLLAGRTIDKLSTQLSSLPGVTSVAAAMGLPTGDYGSNGFYAVEGKQTFAPGQRLPHAGFSLAGPGYFATMGIPLARGREFTSGDRYDAPFVAIISEALARESFPGEDPIGHRLQCGLDAPEKWMAIVGVVGDVRQNSPASSPEPTLYMPLQQHPYYGNEVQVVIRAAVAPASLTSEVRRLVRAANPETAMRFTTLEAMLSDSIANPRFRLTLIGTFAALALLLAMAGVYGVMSYITSQRTSEFGLRTALGAGPSDIVRLVLGGALRLAIIGLTIGLVLSLAASRVMTTMLFGLTPTDAATYAAVCSVLMPVTLLAAAIPAWRASRIDALTALRSE